MLNWLRSEKREEESASGERNRVVLNPSSPDIEGDYETPLLSTGGVGATSGGTAASIGIKSSEGYRCPDLEIATPVAPSEADSSLGLSGAHYEPQRKRYRWYKMEHPS